MFPSLQNLGISSLNEMQETSLKAHRETDHIILLSPTGSGKTLAFLLPLLENLDPGNTKAQAIILAPSRELALQIEQVFRSLKSGFKVVCCYGGHDINEESRSLSYTPTLIIGTPGRILDHITRGTIDTNSISTIILDEFDKAGIWIPRRHGNHLFALTTLKKACFNLCNISRQNSGIHGTS